MEKLIGVTSAGTTTGLEKLTKKWKRKSLAIVAERDLGGS